MISKTELRILQAFLSDLTKGYSIRQLSRELALAYPQTHRAVQSLLSKTLLHKEEKGKSWELTLNLKKNTDALVLAEMERKHDLLRKYPLLNILLKDLESLSMTPLICIIFGSYARGRVKKTSDVDLLLVIPEEYPSALFEKAVKNLLTISQVDIQITTNKGFLLMWQHPLQLNVGNEILKKHIILWGAEAFFLLRKKHLWGETYA